MNTTILKKRSSWTKAGFMLLVVPLSIALTFYWLFPYILHCYLIDYSDFKAMGKNIYISRQMPPSLNAAILEITRRSRERNEEFWGEINSKPIFIFCSTEQEFQQFGHNRGTPAMVHITPFGAFIIAKPDGTNVDVISHEVCHAEFAMRIGWYKKRREIPAWFDEGLALQLDFRYPHSKGHRYADYKEEWKFMNQEKKQQISLPDLQEIDSFFEKDDHWTHLSYFYSGMEVSRWLESCGREGLRELIREVKNGNSFEATYAKIEATYK